MNIAIDDVWSCFRSPFSAVFQYQKKFTDDILDQVKSKREAYNRRARDVRNRQVELHLDELEEKYLCCVCLKKGQDREDEIELVLGKYRISHHEAKKLVDPASSLNGEGKLSSSVREPGNQDPLAAGINQKDEQYATAANGANLSAPAASGDHSRSGTPTPHHQALYEPSQQQRTFAEASARAEIEVMHMVEREMERRRATSQEATSGLPNQHPLSANGSFTGSGKTSSHAHSGRNTPSEHPVHHQNKKPHHHRPSALLDATTMKDVSPLAIKALIDQTRKAILEKQRVTRLEELAKSGKLKKKQAYHRDKGLHRIHETDIDHFSIFFKKPVRGYLCDDCHSAAKNKLDRLTREISAIINRAKEPPLRRTEGTSGRGVVSGERRQQHHDNDEKVTAGPKEGHQVLSAVDITQLRLLLRCGVCQRRQASYFLRKNILFLCEFCTAKDKYYRDHALLICDDPYPDEVASLLRSIRISAEKSEQTARRRVERATVKAAKDYVADATLFHGTNDVDLFRVQDRSLTAVEEQAILSAAVSANIHALDPAPAFDCRESSRHLNGAVPRTVARESGISLFRGYVLQPAVDLFRQWKHEPQTTKQRSDDKKDYVTVVPVCPETIKAPFPDDAISLEALLEPTQAELAAAEAQAEIEVMQMVEREMERRRATSQDQQLATPHQHDGHQTASSIGAARISPIPKVEGTLRPDQEQSDDEHGPVAGVDSDDSTVDVDVDVEGDESGDDLPESRSPTCPVRSATTAFEMGADGAQGDDYRNTAADGNDDDDSDDLR